MGSEGEITVAEMKAVLDEANVHHVWLDRVIDFERFLKSNSFGKPVTNLKAWYSCSLLAPSKVAFSMDLNGETHTLWVNQDFPGEDFRHTVAPQADRKLLVQEALAPMVMEELHRVDGSDED